ncbi:MAG: hypothetical protein SFY95_12435 [Planctomycetota bacterium]|nr:hypothetical protein [Planctomycetota bacterium]
MPTRAKARAAGLGVSALVLAAGLALAQPDSSPSPTPPPTPTPTPTPEPTPEPTREPESAPEAEDAIEDIEETIVTFLDGRKVTGVLMMIEREALTLRIGPIEQRFATREIDRWETLPPISVRYREMRASIPDRDTDARLVLAQWLADKKRYDLALKEVESILVSEPGHPQAEQMKLQYEKLQELARKGTSRTVPGEPVRKRAPEAPARSFPVLSEEQINLIKVYEVDLRDPPRMIIPRELIDELIARFKDHPAMPRTQEGRDDLYRQRPDQIVDLLFRVRARELYGKVKVQDHPPAFKLFRDLVHSSWLMNSCATTRCHGGEQAGRLMLTARRPNSDFAVYTNFLILDRFRMRDGTPLLNWDSPAQSALLQLGLPRNISRVPHPDVTGPRGQRGWEPVFATEQDQRFQDALRWMNAMYRPRPEYPIDYALPTPGTASGAAAPSSPAPSSPAPSAPSTGNAGSPAPAGGNQPGNPPR